MQGRNQENARKAWIDIDSYSAQVLYAATWEIGQDPRIQRVLSAVPATETHPWVQAIVWPRPWTISPLSTKIGDILAWAWIHAPWRVERLVVHTCSATNARALEILSPLWHDRMTQIVVPNFAEVWQMFEIGTKWELKYIDIQKDWKQAIEQFNNSRKAW